MSSDTKYSVDHEQSKLRHLRVSDHVCDRWADRLPEDAPTLSAAARHSRQLTDVAIRRWFGCDRALLVVVDAGIDSPYRVVLPIQNDTLRTVLLVRSIQSQFRREALLAAAETLQGVTN